MFDNLAYIYFESRVCICVCTFRVRVCLWWDTIHSYSN